MAAADHPTRVVLGPLRSGRVWAALGPNTSPEVAGTQANSGFRDATRSVFGSGNLSGSMDDQVVNTGQAGAACVFMSMNPHGAAVQRK